MQLCDIGVNLTNSQFSDDRAQVIEQAQQAGVVYQVVTGTSVAESEQAAQLTQQYPQQLFSTAGVHPHDAKSVTEDFCLTLKRLYQGLDNVVAIGETGLDFNRDFSPRPQQLSVFEQQVELACELNAPLFMHQRDAHQSFMTILNKYASQLPSAVLHCFTGTESELEDCLALGLYIGFTGWICDERRGLDVRALTKLVPDDKILIETDAPYLLPRDLKPKPKSRRNQPKYLPHILAAVASTRQQSEQQVAQLTLQNSINLFNLPQPRQ